LNPNKESKSTSSPKKKSQRTKFKAQISSLEKKFEDRMDELVKKITTSGKVNVGSVVAESNETPSSASINSTQGNRVSLNSILRRNDVQIGAVVANER
jgi:hypothetical protein